MKNNGQLVLAAVVLAVVMLIIVPLSPGALDFLLVVNIAISTLLLLTALYINEELEFSVFPSLLLITTLFRLGLNISSTRLILGNGGEAGEVIKTFGSFVIQSSVVVGFIIFLIILIMQFIVITKGSERVAEVAARFTLDAMPGKQMAIDADLNSGLINEDEARARRLKIQREADFYGAMDGASKFIKGDAIVSIITCAINIIGGIVIGMVSGRMDFGQVIRVYTLATVGDGLVNQIPALLVSTSMGIIVTKAASDGSMGDNLLGQLFGNPFALTVAGGVVALMVFIPGLPKLPLILIGASLFLLSRTMTPGEAQKAAVDERELAAAEAEEERKPENVYSLLQVDPVELEFGYGLIPLADTAQGGDLLDRIVMIRRQCALEEGLILPVVRLRDNLSLKPMEYVIKIRGCEVARGEVMADHYLAMDTGETAEGELEGIDTVEPAFGLPAKWIPKKARDKAELLGYTVVDTPSVISTHLTEVFKAHGHELLGREETQAIVDMVKETHPALVAEVVPKLISVGNLQKVLANLLREGVSIRDMVTIIETLGDFAETTRDIDVLTEYVRQRLRRAITQKHFPNGEGTVITLNPEVERVIAESVRRGEGGSYLTLEPERISAILESLTRELERAPGGEGAAIVVTTPAVRPYFRRMAEHIFPRLAVLSYNEIEQSVRLQSGGTVSMNG